MKNDSKKVEFHPDAWQRFERAVDVVAKTPPQPKIRGKLKTNPKRRGKPKGMPSQSKKRRKKPRKAA